MIGLDTSAIIDLFKGDEKLKKYFEKNKEPITVTMMSYLELYFGLDPKNSEHETEEKYYDDFFKTAQNLNLTKNSCKEASKIFWELKKRGGEIEQFDCVIAALFITNGINKILTRNVKHFENIRQLKAISY